MLIRGLGQVAGGPCLSMIPLCPSYIRQVTQVRTQPLRATVPHARYRTHSAGGVGWAAQRGPVFMLGEPGPFPGGLPPNPACTFQCTGLSGDLCRVRDGVRVDPVVAGCADDERLAPHSCHEGGPRGLSRSGFPERLEAGDLVDCHRGAGLAELAFPSAEPGDQLLARVGGRAGRGVTDDRPPVLPQDDPAESCYQVLLALALHPGLVAGPRSVTGPDFGLMAGCH